MDKNQLLSEVMSALTVRNWADDKLRALAFIAKYGREPNEHELEGFSYKKVLREKLEVVI
jgi:hypothetical protein